MGNKTAGPVSADWSRLLFSDLTNTDKVATAAGEGKRAGVDSPTDAELVQSAAQVAALSQYITPFSDRVLCRKAVVQNADGIVKSVKVWAIDGKRVTNLNEKNAD